MSKRRHKTIDLGTIAVGDYSQEIDLSSFTHAVLFYKWPSSASGSIAGASQPQVDVYFSPTEFGETAVWYEMHSPLSFVGFGFTRRIIPNPISPHAKLITSSTAFFERDRAIPVQPVEPILTFSNVLEYTFGQMPLPRRMRLRAVNHECSGYVQLAREIG